MRIEHIGFVLIAAMASLSIGCDTCKERCDFAADFYESCLPEWNSTWENLGYEGKSDFRGACVDSVNVGRSQVADCCADVEYADDVTEEQIADKQEECESNTLLSIDRQCEDNKELYRQPCSEYWQQVFVFHEEDLPGEDNPTCQDDGEEGDDDSAAGDDADTA